MNIKPLVIYHADCTDGFGAAFAAWLALGEAAEYKAFAYGSDDFPICLNRDIYILDFSFPREVMDHIFANAKHVVWLDHHKTAFEMMGHDSRITFIKTGPTPNKGHYTLLDNNKSGALLAWEYFYPGTKVPMLIQHIDDRDRWQFKLEGSKELHAALWSYSPWSFKQWKAILLSMDVNYAGNEKASASYEQFRAEGAAILRAQDQHVASMAKHARRCSIPAEREVPPNPHTGEGKPYSDWKLINIENGSWWFASGLAVNAMMHISEVGHELANRSGTFGLVWYASSDNRIKCSLRSNGDYDVSAIARNFGGGGHRNAAGFETDIDTLMGWLK